MVIVWFVFMWVSCFRFGLEFFLSLGLVYIFVICWIVAVFSVFS